MLSLKPPLGNSVSTKVQRDTETKCYGFRGGVRESMCVVTKCLPTAMNYNIALCHGHFFLDITQQVV